MSGPIYSSCANSFPIVFFFLSLSFFFPSFPVFIHIFVIFSFSFILPVIYFFFRFFVNFRVLRFFSFYHFLKHIFSVISIPECKSKPADIAFIIDDSRSIYGPDFYKGMEFIENFVDIFQIGPQDVRIAAVTFGQIVITYSTFGFEANNNKREVLNALGRIKFKPRYGSATFTDKAITYARNNFFNHARPNVKKVAIILTDGRSEYPPKTKAEAELLKSQDVDIIAIGVGSAVEESEQNSIASSPDSVFLVNSYGALKKIIRSLRFITCRGKL
ncbi:unnamed protein product [Acanthosepion pharaonis]|uniref:VWFA domain-containing protein n=1 Tax=Acanthosepion pharaonis TaxID=158019 RepID=A0A812BYR7_ACAPH|nr:unnamed protein product [Sepia pharaonis]